MRPSRLALVAALAAATALAGFRLASAKDEGGTPELQKAIVHPFTDALLGSWTVETVFDMGDGPIKGKGSAVFAKGVGGTAILETYESASDGGSFSGHAVYKLSADRSTITCWWFDVLSAEPTKFTGPITEKGLDMSADTPQGKLRITIEKSDATLSFKMYTGAKAMMTGEYKRAAK